MWIWNFINTIVRIILTAYFFALFAIKTVWLSKWVIPRILKSEGEILEKRAIAQRAANKVVASYIGGLDYFHLIRFEILGKPVDSPCIAIANHPTLLDYIILMLGYPRSICLYKTETLRNPFLSAYVQLTGCIEGMDGSREANERIIEESGARLREGLQLVVFPEGTRSESATSIRRFRATIFHAAIQNETVVQPVAIFCQPLFLGKHQPWLEFSKAQNRMVISYLDPIHMADLPQDKRTAQDLSNMVYTRIEQELKRLNG